MELLGTSQTRSAKLVVGTCRSSPVGGFLGRQDQGVDLYVRQGFFKDLLRSRQSFRALLVLCQNENLLQIGGCLESGYSRFRLLHGHLRRCILRQGRVTRRVVVEAPLLPKPAVLHCPSPVLAAKFQVVQDIDFRQGVQ
jgi:UDP-2,3-diacylglucosamine pyrophosphatase LpxH